MRPRTGPVITPLPGRWKSRVSARVQSFSACAARATGQAPAGTCRRWMGHMEVFTAWDPTDPDAPASSRSKLEAAEWPTCGRCA